jgi:pilus assembly protein Flp/PilA
MNRPRLILQRFLADERGATAIEYGLILGLMTIALLAGINNFADANNANYEMIEENLVH